VIQFEVLGTPAPKGSTRAMLIGGRPRVIASGTTVNQQKLKAWDVAVREAAREAIGDASAPPFVKVPVRIAITFRMARPSGHYSKATGKLKPSAPSYPTTKPDSSKLLRQTEDTLTGIVFDDDARIVQTFVEKLYAEPGDEGAVIIVEAMSSVATSCATVEGDG